MRRPFSLLGTLLFFLLLLGSCSTPNPSTHIPSLEKISGQWVSADTVAMEPSIRNFRGQAVVNRDITSISWFASAPYSGGYHTDVLKINGIVPEVSMFRWQPYQALRKSTVDQFEITSSTRMLPDEDGVCWRIEITNTSRAEKDLQIDLDAIGFISKYGGDWQWWYPYPKLDGITSKRDEEVELVRKHIGKKNEGEIFVDELIEGKPSGKKMPAKWPSDNDILASTKYSAKSEDAGLMVFDNESDAITGFGFISRPDSLSLYRSGGTARWQWKLKPGEKKILDFFMTYGDNEVAVRKNIKEWKNAFPNKFENAKKTWEEKWQQIFSPGNPVLSGCFPVLETTDTLAKRLYYTRPLTML